MPQKTALLFVNGEPPKDIPSNIKDYTYIACTDGAYHSYLFKSAVEPDFIIGDLDSIDSTRAGVTKFTIYGASGGASDHFLGNLSIAMQYYHQFKMLFYDNYCYFFFADHHQIIDHVKNHIISLMPLSTVTNLTITGFEYPLKDQTLVLGGCISLRNKAINDKVEISFKNGDLLILIQNDFN